MWVFAGRAGSAGDSAWRAVQEAGGAGGPRSGGTAVRVSGSHGPVAQGGDSGGVSVASQRPL